MADTASNTNETSTTNATNMTDATGTTTGTTAAPAATAQPAGKRDLLPAERQDAILSLLTRQSVATVPELATMLNTTEITIRRDLTVLSKAGLLKRVRGGAMSIGSSEEHAAPAANPILSGALTERTLTGGVAVKPVLHSPELGGDQPAIGVMLPEPSFFWPGVIDNMRTIASRMGLRIITRESTYDTDVREDDILTDLTQDPTVCGLIVAPNSHPETGRRTWDWIAHADIPTVVIERDLPLLTADYVDTVRTNHPYGVRKAATHFIRHGHRFVGAAFTDTPTSDMIQEGWRDVVEETDLIQCPFIFDGIQPYDTKGVNGIVDKILLSGVTGMLVHSDYLAIAIAQTLERRGRHVPEDVSLISVDGFATPSSRPLTVLRSSDKDLAEAAISTLIHRIQNPDSATRHTLVDPNLIDRGSVVDVPAQQA
ncbi:substrate-binding domain-containing protein [Bifidobacterium saguinibicoloris]|uniref:substrate-binding domain-containing protein n=1 Tax=Bifidobacterium saguinibicoloris TaxID=2834433 RepID=UPI001C5A3BFD|nr:substrate-binding domain-containing protein [Bifidobacterium saguinibicoloris]MBW3080286.1 DeoR/GlpR family transcriptional regulator [Bifidobacterium saguinibicoloris]